MSKVAVYAGSFDPFTNGHLSIVKEASEIFDEVYVVLASNSSKKRSTSVNDMSAAMADAFMREGLYNCRAVTLTDGLVADFCKLCNADYLVRGLRNTSDYMYEENIAKINREINPTLKTIYLRADNEVISSSLVRELMHYKKDVSKYVPQEILKLLKKAD